jgi:putative ABC transport system permease protein
VLLIFMNLGFLGALLKTSTDIYSQMDADVFLVSPQTLELSTSESFPRDRLYQTQSISGVIRTMPVYVGYMQWRNPETRRSRALFAFAFNPRDPVFLMPEFDDPELIAAIERPNTVLFDRRSRPEFGPQTPGTTTEVDRRQVTIVGNYTLGGGFTADGTAILSDQNFLRFFSPRPLDRIDMGLIQLAEDADVEAVVEAIDAKLPNDVLVLTKEEIIAREQRYWLIAASLGFIFGLGVAVSFVVGTVIVYQIIYTDISDHYAEYATLKAMGYRNGFLFSVVIQEALILAMMGYIPGYFASVGVYALASRATSGTLPMSMNTGRAMFVLVLTIAMCCISGLISVRKVMSADPAEVFS